MNSPALDRISNVLERHYAPYIDMGDYTKHSPDQQKTCFLSRALAALAIKTLAFADPETAARAVVDGFDDGGIDAMYFDASADTFFLVQSKWFESSTKPLDPDTIRKFISGIRDLLSCRFDRFNEKIRAKEADIKSALYSERPIRTRIIIAHTSSLPVPLHVSREIYDFIDQLNDPVKSFFLEFYDLSGTYKLITHETEPAKIKLQIGMSEWGSIERPFLAYYGRVHIKEIKQWWKDYSHNLFTHNLRLYNSRSDVNEALRKTLSADKEYFWYFNNGITVICDKVIKGAAGSPSRAIGVFTCEGASIVNGAQTVGTIGDADFDEADPENDPQDAWVLVRIISLEKAAPEFGRRITRAANLQNAVGNREFAAMDPLQHRLSADFALDQRRYVYKSGEADPKGDEGCSIVEATQALGCRASLALAVQVKREIGAVWADTTAAPYTDLFNEKLSSTALWRSVLVLRAVDDELHRCKKLDLPRADMLSVHMNRLILHLVFQEPDVRKLDYDSASIQHIIGAAKSSVEPIFYKVSEQLERLFENDYLASLCKNQSKCEDIVSSLRPRRTADIANSEMPTRQTSMFDEL